jgi:AraC-like DNA-binding protein
MSKELRDTFLSQLATPLISERLFAQVPDIVFCIKNLDGIYISANQAFAFRLGLPSHRDILGKSARQLFPEYLATIYEAQDHTVFTSGQDIIDQLELVNSRQRGMGWYLASKLPLKDKNGEVIGLASISRDLLKPGDEDLKFAGLARTVEFIQKHFSEDLKLTDLAIKNDLSVIQLDRRMKKIFKLSTSQFIRKTRIEAASKMLRSSSTPIAQIALECGYSDQSALTRQFKSTVGMTPGEYRIH